MAESYRSRPAPFDAGASSLVWWGLVVAAVAYVGYLALLIACDLMRVVPFGFVPEFGPEGAMVAIVQPETVAARGGLRVNDRILRANGQVLEGRVDWQRVRVHLDPSRPLDLEIDRGGRLSTIRLPLSAGPAEWRTGPPRPGLAAFRLAQVITLGLALVVGFRRPSRPAALLGAWLLASFATITVVLPNQMFVFWHALPQPLEGLLWLPYATSAALGPLLLAFFAVFPRRTLSRATLVAALVPGVLAMCWFVYLGYHLARSPGSPTGVPDLRMWIFATSIFYAFVAAGLLLAHHRSADNLTDLRRIRVLLVGMAVGVTAGAAFLAGYQLDGEADIFGSRLLTVLALVFLAVPGAFGYAILRHRLFGLRLIVRQGVRYALARRVLDALIPMVAALLLAEMVMHSDEPLGDLVQSRWWWYLLAVAALLLIRNRRERWLKALDRRFFRERYDAERLLKNILDQIARAPSFDSMAPSMVQQIDEALHPTFVEVLRHTPGEQSFAQVATTLPASVALPSSLTAIGVLSALRKPLALSLGDTAWVRHQLPIEERTLLLGRGIELLVPVFPENGGEQPIALVVLGPRRSEEPYNNDDLDLLTTMAQGLGILIGRSSIDTRGMAECGRCGRCFDRGTELCTVDASPLTRAHGSRLLNGRYRLERRLGRGGMGTVYEATDDLLDRKVAVKVTREDLAGTMINHSVWADLDARFRREARAAAGFAHAHVVRVYDFGVDRDRRAFLVMELLEGETLRQRLALGVPMAPQEAMGILRGVCDALTAAHSHGLLHRDLKPENIFLHRHEGGVISKVLDFGLAKALAVEQPSGDSDDTRGTSAGLLIGTLDYMAPEQVAGAAVSPAWDIWALSVIAYEMLTARHPFRRTITFTNDETGSTGAAIGAGQTDRPLSAAAAGLFETALSVDGSRRPRTPAEFLAACEQVLV